MTRAVLVLGLVLAGCTVAEPWSPRGSCVNDCQVAYDRLPPVDRERLLPAYKQCTEACFWTYQLRTSTSAQGVRSAP